LNSVIERARSSWLLAFGDVITLLLTFFIVVIVMNKSDISKIEHWVDQQLNTSFQQLEAERQQQGYQLVSIQREPRGILLTIAGDNSFQSGDYIPSAQLDGELKSLGEILANTHILNVQKNEALSTVIRRAQEDGMIWASEIVVQGHTDNDWVDPESRLRNNFFLSTLRAESVMRLLQKYSGLNPKQFAIAGYGEWQPVSSNDTPEGKKQNRRIEVLITASFQNNGH